jgi:hypothetical protein
MTHNDGIPEDATAIAKCSCGAVAWTTATEHTDDDQQWFDDFNAAHEACDPPDATHTNPSQPVFGYIADDREFFIRALKAKDRAEHSRDYGARAVANAVIDTPEDTWRVESSAEAYRRDVAALGYAKAVYEVEAAKVRAA